MLNNSEEDYMFIGQFIIIEDDGNVDITVMSVKNSYEEVADEIESIIVHDYNDEYSWSPKNKAYVYNGKEDSEMKTMFKIVSYGEE